MAYLRLLVFCALALSPASCLLNHSLRNGPGHIDIRQPPEDLENRQPIVPDDPGEYSLKWNVALLPSVSVIQHFSPSSSKRAAFGLSAESALSWGWDKESVLYPWAVYARTSPRNAIGVNAGTTILAAPNHHREWLYAEVFYLHTTFIDTGIGLGTGAVRDFSSNQTGWQSTALLWPLFVRVSLFPRSNTVTAIGIALKLPILLTHWSR
jgi:hypothetical protein